MGLALALGGRMIPSPACVSAPIDPHPSVEGCQSDPYAKQPCADHDQYWFAHYASSTVLLALARGSIVYK
jgi:hypothetical protein